MQVTKKLYSILGKRSVNLAYIHTAVFLFGMAGLFAGFVNQPSEIIVLGRVAFASVSLFLFLKIQKQKIWIETGKDLRNLCFSGFLLAFHWYTFFLSIRLTNVAVGLITYSTFPVFVAFIEPFSSRKKLNYSSVFYALIAIAGIFLISFRSANNEFELNGIVAGVLSGLSFAFLSVINKKLSKTFGSVKTAFYQNSSAFVVLLPFLFINIPSFNTHDFLLILLLGVVFTAVSHTLFIEGLKKIPAFTAGMIACLEPVYGIIFSIFLLSQIPAWNVIAGGLLVFSAMVISVFRNQSET